MNPAWWLLGVTAVVLVSVGWALMRGEPKEPPRGRGQHIPPARPVVTYWPEPTDKRGWR